MNYLLKEYVASQHFISTSRREGFRYTNSEEGHMLILLNFKRHLLRFHLIPLAMGDKKRVSDGKKELNLHQMDKWANREYMKRFFDYGDTQILELSKNKSIVTSRVGNRLFFEVNSIIKFLDNNIEQKKN
jgi:hypothetical protein